MCLYKYVVVWFSRDKAVNNAGCTQYHPDTLANTFRCIESDQTSTTEEEITQLYLQKYSGYEANGFYDAYPFRVLTAHPH